MIRSHIGDITYYSDKSGGDTKGYICDVNGKIVEYNRDSSYMKFEFRVRSTGIREFEYNDDDYLDEALNKFKKGIKMVNAGTHIDTLMRFEYKEPQSFSTGIVMKFRNDIDFTNTNIINAILQINPKVNGEYTIPATILCILVREYIPSDPNKYIIKDIKFVDNKIMFEGPTTVDLRENVYGKSITDNGYILQTRRGDIIHYCCDKTNKLTVIDKHNCYYIQILDNNNIKITLKGEGNAVDAEDIAYAFGKPLSEYKFEYLV
jgi:hypothetical protein